MKAVVLHEYGGPDKLKLEEVADPVAGEGEMLVRVAATSVNPVDFKMRSGEAKDRFPVQFPGILGRDLSGIVRSLGPNTRGFQPGDRVFALTSQTYAELCVVKVTDAALLPPEISLVDAAALPLVTLTGEQLIRLGAEVQAGQTILIAGAVGAVGRSAVRTATLLGAKVIAGVRQHQVKEAESLGAMHVLALDDKEAIAKLGLLDAVADAVGGDTAETLLGKVKQGGIFASVLGPPKNAALHPTIRIAPIMAHPDPEAMLRMAQEVQAGRLIIPIDRRLPLDDAGAGQAAAEKGGIGKVLLLT